MQKLVVILLSTHNVYCVKNVILNVMIEFYRLWCQEQNAHVDRLRCPIHVAAETGQLAIFRTFVHVDTCSIFASDGHALKPLNISLRKKQKAITSFLLTKQWTSVPYGSSKQTIPLYLYSKLKKWGDRARDRAILKYGMSKSSMKVILSSYCILRILKRLKSCKIVLHSQNNEQCRSRNQTWKDRDIFKFLCRVLLNHRSDVFCFVMYVNCCRVLRMCGIVSEPKKVCSRDSPSEHGGVC